MGLTMAARKSGPHDTPAKSKDSETDKKIDDELDEALEESFPASDPPSMTQPPHSKQDKDEI